MFVGPNQNPRGSKRQAAKDGVGHRCGPLHRLWSYQEGSISKSGTTCFGSLLKTYTDEHMEVTGMLKLWFQYGNKEKKLVLVVVHVAGNGLNLFWWYWLALEDRLEQHCGCMHGQVEVTHHTDMETSGTFFRQIGHCGTIQSHTSIPARWHPSLFQAPTSAFCHQRWHWKGAWLTQDAGNSQEGHPQLMGCSQCTRS